jgi:hypothetical protein
MVFATTWIHVLELKMLAVFAMVRARFMTAVAMTSQLGNVIAMATNLTLQANAVARAQRMRTMTVFVTTMTRAQIRRLVISPIL